MKRLLAHLLWLCAAASPGDGRALTFPLTGDEVVGKAVTIATRYEDTFVSLGKRFGVGFRELTWANPGVLPWVPGEGTAVVIPTRFVLPAEDREAVVLNLAEFRLYHFLPERGEVRTYPVGIGREGWQTPVTETRVTRVQPDPPWIPPESIRREHAAMGDILPAVVPPGPDNPLGKYAVRLALPGYLIHGTNKKIGIGMRVSHGCVRLDGPDIEEFAHSVRPGTPVRIVNEPVKAGWRGERLYLEVHPPLEEHGDAPPDPMRAIGEALARRPHLVVDVDWEKVRRLLELRHGVPEDVTLRLVKRLAQAGEP
ncbi:MAG: hypothetical protein KatS3mg124_2306 [Porticoccaceae bacterium]|nr:MAG: hypothetical protein KatS3mg124_2306 [Porticoccaceae bacterium]